MSERVVYPVVLREDKGEKIPYYVYIPDFDGSTQGTDLADALYMAEDFIALSCVDMEDDGETFPEPTLLEDVVAEVDGVAGIKTLVAADLKAYRAMLDNRAVKKTLSIPSWLNVAAEKAHINFSAVLQEALKAKLGLMK